MTEYARLVVAVDSTQVGRADVALNEFGRTTSLVEKRADSLSRSISGLARPIAALVAGISVKSLIDMSDNYGQMADRIRMVTESTDEYRKVQDRLLQSANSTYRPLAEAQELFIRTADTIRSLGYETEDALDITDSFSYLLVTNAASADRASSAINAYSKAIQTGKVDSESWQSLLAAMPSVVETLADQLGKSSNEIRELGITGKLALADLNEGLRRSVEENQRLADGMGTTLNDAIIRASNNWSAYLGENERVTGASRLMSGALDTVSENLETVAGIASGVAVAAMARYSVAVAQNTTVAVANYRAKQVQAVEELRTAQAQAASTAAALAQARANVGLVGSINSVAVATAAHEAAQKRLAAAQTASVSVGRAALGLAGGWAGLAITAGAVAASFIDWGNNAEEAARQSIALREETNLLTRAVQELDAAQAKQVLQRMEEPYQAAKDEARNYAAQIEYLNIQLDRHPGSAKVDDWRRSLVEAEGNLSTVNAELAKQEAKMRELNARIEQNTANRRENNLALGETDAAGNKFLEQLQRQADFAGKLTETQRVKIAIEKGYASALSETDQQAALTYAGIIDRANAAAQATKGLTKDTNDLESSYQSTVASIERQIALYGQTSEVAGLRFDIESGSLKGIVGQQADYLIGLARELDAKRDLTEQEKLRIDILRGSGQLRAANDAQFELEYAEKIAEYERQGNVEALQRLETLRRIREVQMNADQAPGTVEGVSQAPQSGFVSPEIGGPSSELMRIEQEAIALDQWREAELEKQRAFLETQAITKETYLERERNIFQQHQDQLAQIESSRQQVQLAAGEAFFGNMAGLTAVFAGEQSSAYKAMFALEKSYALAKVLMNAPKTASDAYSAMAGIPYIGPALGVAAAAAALSYQAVQASGIRSVSLSGMAHDGIDSIPREGTWLLDKGERVVDRRTNADLKDYLAGGGGQGGGKGDMHVHQTLNINGDVSPQTVELIQNSQRQVFEELARDAKMNGPYIQMVRSKM